MDQPFQFEGDGKPAEVWAMDHISLCLEFYKIHQRPLLAMTIMSQIFIEYQDFIDEKEKS